MLADFLSDVLYGLRMMRKNTGFTAIAVLTLALGIGLNSAIFSLVNAVLFKPLPVESPDELITVWNRENDDFITHTPMAYLDYQDLRDSNRTLESLSAYSMMPLAVDRGDESEMVIGQIATENYFHMLGVRPALGRTFLPEESKQRAANPYVVLHHAAWQRRFGGDPTIVGKTMRLNGHVFTIIGVAPEGFDGLIRGFPPEMWVPMMMSPVLRSRGGVNAEDGDPSASSDDRIDRRSSRWLWVMGRLKPGATLAQADSDLHAIGERLREQYPDSNKNRVVGVLPAADVKLIPGVDKALFATSFVLMGFVALILLIASANVANMLLARATARRREIAVRLSLGAGRARLVRQLFTESLLLAIAGGAAGLLLAWWSNQLLNTLPLHLPLPVKMGLGLALDIRVFAFTFLVAVVTAAVFGLAPAIQSTKADLVTTLKEEAGSTTGGGSRRRLTSALVVAQVAVSLILLIAAGLSVRSAANAHRINPGFDSHNVVVGSFSPGLRGYTPEQEEAFFTTLAERMRAMPGVESAGLTSHVPLTFEINIENVAAEGKEPAERKDWPESDAGYAGAGYFETLRIPVLRGRAFTEEDTRQPRRVAVVNEIFASRFFPNEEPIGKRIRVEGEDQYDEIVGVVRNGKYRTLGEDPRPFLWRPVAKSKRSFSASTLLIRASSDPRPVLAALRQEARQLDEKVPVIGLRSLDEATSVSLLFPRMGAVLFGLFGALGMMLAAVGLYGVIAYSATQRTHEIGIRMALGASRGDVLKLILGQGLTLTGIGVVLGLAGAFGVTSMISVLLYGISPTDPLTFAGISLLLLAVAALACYIPARRAARVDPMIALRYE
jgi:predicted permease